MSTAERPLRADAERNRQRILAAASEVFAERGLHVSLDDIAAAAGVGVGTVYRRFPSKDDLIEALFEDKIVQLESIAIGALELDDPWECFETFVRGVCRLQAHDRGLKEALASGDCGRDRVRKARGRMAPLGFKILGRAQAAGVVRDDLAGFDVPMMNFTLGWTAERTRDVSPDYFERLLTVMLDGLRTPNPTPLPSPPLTPEQFLGAMSGKPQP